MERYLEYERCRVKYTEVQEVFAKVLMEKERLFTKILPSAIRYDKDKVQSTIDGNPLEDYVISVEDKELDEKIAKYRQILKDWQMLLDIKEAELRRSRAIIDRVYVYRYLDQLGINRIARLMNYSRSQVYRKIQMINKKMRQNATSDVL